MCNKLPFTKRDAETALKWNKKSSKQYRKEVRHYYCEEHNAWHLTSKEYAPSEEMGDLELILEKDRWEKLLNKNNE